MRVSVCSIFLIESILSRVASSFIVNPTPKHTRTSTKLHTSIPRRTLLFSPILLLPTIASAATVPDIPPAVAELPPDAARSYLQYRFPLQFSSDYFLFDLRPRISNTDEWESISELFASFNGGGGVGQPSKVERDFLNPMRIVSLSMIPEVSEEMTDSALRFELAMNKVRKAVYGIRANLPVEIDPALVPLAEKGWEEARVALNEFLAAMNKATESEEMKLVPVDKRDYPRSERKYLEFKKKLKQCQNRGGPALSAAWGQLMVSGYLQDSCGIPDLKQYFHQD